MKRNHSPLFATGILATLALSATLVLAHNGDDHGSSGRSGGDDIRSTSSPGAAGTASPGATTQPTPCPSGATATPGPGAQCISVSIPQGATGKGSAAYGTNPLVIPANTTVTWTNDDTAPHTVTANDGRFDSGTLQNGQTFSHTFTEPGTYPYYCTIHGQQSMNGTIQVEAASGGTGTPSPTASASPSSSPSSSPTSSPGTSGGASGGTSGGSSGGY